MIFRNNLVVVSCAGNIKLPLIRDHINNGFGYPNYIGLHKVFFPGDCRNAITVGSYADRDSNLAEMSWPSPFTRSSPSLDLFKPEVMSCGGNINAVYSGGQITSFSSVGLGVRSTSNNDSDESENIGTSFCSPTVANLAALILLQYPSISPFLVKALILSSCESLRNRSRDVPEYSIQGFGKPNKTKALYSQNWRTCYLLEGEFETEDADKEHRYRFLFPDEADEFEVTLVCGKLHTMFDGEKADYVRLRITRPGIKFGTQLMPQVSLGESKCFHTYKAWKRIRRGSKGFWTVEVIPHFFSSISNQRLKYACVITVSSSRGAEVYTPIINLISPKKEEVEVMPVPQLVPSSISSTTT